MVDFILLILLSYFLGIKLHFFAKLNALKWKKPFRTNRNGFFIRLKYMDKIKHESCLILNNYLLALRIKISWAKKTGRQLEDRVTPCITPKNQMKTIYI